MKVNIDNQIFYPEVKYIESSLEKMDKKDAKFLNKKIQSHKTVIQKLFKDKFLYKKLSKLYIKQIHDEFINASVFDTNSIILYRNCIKYLSKYIENFNNIINLIDANNVLISNPNNENFLVYKQKLVEKICYSNDLLKQTQIKHNLTTKGEAVRFLDNSINYSNFFIN